MVQTIYSFNLKELKQYSVARKYYIEIVNRLRTEANLSVYDSTEMFVRFEQDSDLGIQEIKNHFNSQKEDQKVLNDFIEFFKKLRIDLLSGLSIQDQVQHDPEFDKLKLAHKENPNDLENSFNLACKAADLSKYELAFQMLLEIIEKDKTWNNNKAVEKIVELFGKCQSSTQVLKYRKQLSFLLN